MSPLPNRVGDPLVISPLDLPSADDQAAGPAWRRIEAALRVPIVDGRWRPGAKLPVEAEMAAHFNVNRHTLRRSVAALARDGFVTATQGKGTFVARGDKVVVSFGGAGGPTQAIQRAGAIPYARAVSTNTREAGLKLGQSLGIGAQRAVLEVDVVLLADTLPIGLTTLWLAHERFSRFPDALRQLGLIEGALRSFGVLDVVSASNLVSAREASERECLLLKAPSPLILLVCDTCYNSQSGERCLVAQTRWSAKMVNLVADAQLAGDTAAN